MAYTINDTGNDVVIRLGKYITDWHDHSDMYLRRYGERPENIQRIHDNVKTTILVMYLSNIIFEYDFNGLNNMVDELL